MHLYMHKCMWCTRMHCKHTFAFLFLFLLNLYWLPYTLFCFLIFFFFNFCTICIICFLYFRQCRICTIYYCFALAFVCVHSIHTQIHPTFITIWNFFLSFLLTNKKKIEIAISQNKKLCIQTNNIRFHRASEHAVWFWNYCNVNRQKKIGLYIFASSLSTNTDANNDKKKIVSNDCSVQFYFYLFQKKTLSTNGYWYLNREL